MQPRNMKRNKTHLNFKNFFKFYLFIFIFFPVALCLPWFLCTQQPWATAQPLPPHTQGILCKAALEARLDDQILQQDQEQCPRQGVCLQGGCPSSWHAVLEPLRLEKPSKTTRSNHSQPSRDGAMAWALSCSSCVCQGEQGAGNAGDNTCPCSSIPAWNHWTALGENCLSDLLKSRHNKTPWI